MVTKKEMSPGAERQARRELEWFVKERTIIVDTCSISDDYFEFFLESVTPLLQTYQKQLIIPYRCTLELEKHATNKEEPGKAADAERGKKLLAKLKAQGLIRVLATPEDKEKLAAGVTHSTFADEEIQIVLMRYRKYKKLLLITQDRDLSYDVLQQNDSKSVQFFNKVEVRRIDNTGYLGQPRLKNYDNEPVANTRGNGARGNNWHPKPRVEAPVPEAERFQLASAVTAIPNEPLAVSHIPDVGEEVHTADGARIRLESQLNAGGGEGIIYATNTATHSVAKIYKKNKVTRRNYEKIKLMLTKKINCPGICAPEAALYNDADEFVGYLMPQAKGETLQRGVFIKPRLMKLFPHWKKRDTIELCITILDKIKYLHDRNIIMGDINPNNILVVSPTEVYFVDVDSYQVGEFPCPVGTIPFTAPEIQHLEYSTFLRTIGNENFAVATLLFMIMLPGKTPYAQQGGSDQATNIINMDFSYPCGDNSNKKTPEGPWRYIWSHLTRKLKEAFYNTFRKGGDYSTEGTRLGASEWRELFESYRYAIDSGRMGETDKQSEELFPTALKKIADAKYVKCRLCGREVAENNCLEGICRECLDSGETRHCAKCGREFIYKNYEKYIKHHGPNKLCDECHEQSQQAKYKQTCVDCGQVFTITNSEYEFYNSKGLNLPKRCKSCREANRNNGGHHHGGSGCMSTIMTYALAAIVFLVMATSLFK